MALPALDALEDLPSIDLGDLPIEVALAERYDLKCAGRLADIHRLVDILRTRAHVVHVEGRAHGLVTTVYYDTPEALSFWDHARKRRRRYKVRIRRYGDADAAFLEVKAKGSRGQTVKYRTPFEGAAGEDLSNDARAYVAGVLREHDDIDLPRALVARATTEFARATLVDLDRGERYTVDWDIRARVSGQEIRFDPTGVIIETKGLQPIPDSARTLRRAGFRRMPMSKYCLATAAADTSIAANDWIPAMRWFGLGRYSD